MTAKSQQTQERRAHKDLLKLREDLASSSGMSSSAQSLADLEISSLVNTAALRGEVVESRNKHMQCAQQLQDAEEELEQVHQVTAKLEQQVSPLTAALEDSKQREGLTAHKLSRCEQQLQTAGSCLREEHEEHELHTQLKQEVAALQVKVHRANNRASGAETSLPAAQAKEQDLVEKLACKHASQEKLGLRVQPGLSAEWYLMQAPGLLPLLWHSHPIRHLLRPTVHLPLKLLPSPLTNWHILLSQSCSGHVQWGLFPFDPCQPSSGAKRHCPPGPFWHESLQPTCPAKCPCSQGSSQLSTACKCPCAESPFQPRFRKDCARQLDARRAISSVGEWTGFKTAPSIALAHLPSPLQTEATTPSSSPAEAQLLSSSAPHDFAQSSELVPLDLIPPPPLVQSDALTDSTVQIWTPARSQQLSAAKLSECGQIAASAGLLLTGGTSSRLRRRPGPATNSPSPACSVLSFSPIAGFAASQLRISVRETKKQQAMMNCVAMTTTLKRETYHIAHLFAR
ncbi:TPA: hypothetical protein ACH3X2_006379 [Trebouxia sp. C0005]